MKRGISASVLSLALGCFVLGLAEFAPMVLLPDIARSLAVTIPEAGYLISAYALGVVVGSPLVVVLAGNVAPRKMLVGLVVGIAVFNGLCAVAPDYGSLVAFRFLSGLPHGAFFGIGAVVAARTSAPGRAASAFAVMLGGLTVCNIAGVPLIAYAGHAFGWRLSFLVVAAVGVLALASIVVWVPAAAHESKASTGANISALLKNRDFLLSILIAAIGLGGFFAWYSYLVPQLLHQAKLTPAWIPWVMALAGVGMTFGSYLGGRLSDQLSPLKAVIVVTLSMAVVLGVSALLADIAWASIAMIFVTSVNAMALGAPTQMLLMSQSTESELLGSSIGPAAFNVGNALGAYLAGLPLAWGYAYSSANWVGAALCLTGAVLALGLFRRQLRMGRLQTTPLSSVRLQWRVNE